LAAENVAFSPASIFVALAMAGDGARGETEAAFQAALGVSRTEAHQLAGSLMNEWTAYDGAKVGPKVKIVPANSAWLRQDVELLPAYQSGLEEDLGAKVTPVDFSDPDTVAEINSWVNQQTEGLIPHVVKKIDPNDVLMLFNTLYFKGSWEEEFDEDATGPDDFTLSSGDVTEVETMHGTISGQYFEAEDGSRGAVLPYDDSRFGLLAVLPANGADQIDWADGRRLNEWLDLAEHNSEIKVSLPKWEIDTGSIDLKQSLTALGLEQAFGPGADFSGLGRTELPLYVSSARHTTVVKVDETGTEAASVTDVGIGVTAVPPLDEPVRIDFDRPFFYAIMDLDTGVPLFMGLMRNPQE
jgi:serpin B